MGRRGGRAAVRRRPGCTCSACSFGGAFTNPADLADLDFFPFPYFGNQYDAEKALDAPIDGWHDQREVAEPDGRPRRRQGLHQLLVEGLDPEPVPQVCGRQPGGAKDADISTYSPLQNKAVQVVSDAQKITQFLDRDTRPDFAGPNGMQGFLQSYLKDPKQDLAKLQGQIQAFWDGLPPTG